MSANLWQAESVISSETQEGGIYACSGTRGVRTNVALDRLATNQTFHCGFSANPGKDDNFSMALCYRDAAGYINYAFTTDVSVPAGKWTRVSGSVVVPSGMTVYQMVICNNGNTSGASGWKVTNPTLSLGSPVPLASSAHTPYATQDHVAAEYATKAALKVTSDAVTAEVEERGKLAGRVDGLESTSDTHTSKLEQLATSIKSLVRGESTYTDPDGQSATSGIYSLVTQTRDSVTALFGDYTKTEDLAATDAVKDAKKAGTDAQAAASAAQTTADSASSTAGAAKSTADSLATMVRQYSGGVLVCKVGQQVGALVNADGSFDVADVTWDGETPTAGKKLMRLAKNSIEFNNPDTSYNICNITANGTLTNIYVPNGSLAIDETPAWCQAIGDSGYDSFIAGKMLQLGAGNRRTYSEILIEPDGTTINGYKFALGTNNTTDTWVPVMGGNSNAGHLVHRVINLKWGPNAYAVYGAYNPNNGGDHYYTTNVNEYNKLIKSGWTGSGVYFYAAL